MDHQEIADKVARLSPVEVRRSAAQTRVTDFSEFEQPFTETEALAEAQRCLACTAGAFVDDDRCAGCLTCVRMCPFGVAQVDKTAVMPEESCLACGLCAAECPAAAVALQRFGTNRMRTELSNWQSSASQRARACRNIARGNPTQMSSIGSARSRLLHPKPLCRSR